MAAARFANPVRDPDRVVPVEYLPAARCRVVRQTLYGPTDAEAVRKVCQSLDVAPDRVRALEHAGQLAIGVRRADAVELAAVVRGGLTADQFNDAAAALQRHGWRP